MNNDASRIADHFADIPRPTGPAIDLEERGRQYLAESKRRSAAAYFEARCPKAYRQSDWNHPGLVPNRAAIERVRNWQFGKMGLLAAGRTGRGKSRAMWCLCSRLLIEEARDLKIYNAQEFFAQLQAQVNFGRDDAEGWIHAVASHDLLFIDDYGQEALTNSREEWARSWFFRLLDIRIEADRPLLITTNLSAQQMAESAGDLRGDPLVRRIMDAAEPVRFL